MFLSDFKMHIEVQETLYSQSNSEQKEQRWRSPMLHFLLYYETIDRQWNRIKGPEINPHSYTKSLK